MTRDELIERVVEESRDSYARQETWHTFATRIVDRLSKELPAIVLDAQLRALDRGRLDTPDELNSAKWIATAKAAKEQAND